MNQKGLTSLVLVGIIVVFLGTLGYFVWPKKSISPVVESVQVETNEAADWKTYADTQNGFEFQYPEKLSLSVSGGAINLSHSIPFKNYDGGCDMKGEAELSETLNDFDLSIKIISNQPIPAYFDGAYSMGVLSGNWVYMGVEGCGKVSYYFPISENRTLVVEQAQIQMLSDVVVPERRAQILAVPGVISPEESKLIFDQVLSTFKFIEPVTKIDTSNWKTYTSSQYGFELKYPINWYPYLEGGNVLFLKTKEMPKLEGTEGYALGEQIIVGTSDLIGRWNKQLSVDEYIKEYYPDDGWGDGPIVKKTININGMEMLRIESPTCCTSSRELKYLYFNNDKAYFFYLYPYEPEKDLLYEQNYKDFQNLINTFKFTK